MRHEQGDSAVPPRFPQTLPHEAARPAAADPVVVQEPAPAVRPQQPLLQQVPCPPQAPPLLEHPHEGPPPGPPQTERVESPASVWTAVPPTGLPGAGMPGAWSVAASAAGGQGGVPPRPVPLQQAPLGREHRP
ncbi:hypothetical protein [Streptomyces sp. URMC 124]|uniref:hypothetical protein n=1 Tax=Streptomyces sp. URMC 124 TaxID=3423405 RepID=UPI003F1C3660